MDWYNRTIMDTQENNKYNKENHHEKDTQEAATEQTSSDAASSQSTTNDHQSDQKTKESSRSDGSTADEARTESVNDAVELTAEQQRDLNMAGWQRATADLQNLKKRHEEERAMFTAIGKESLLRDLIPMMDNFEAAFSNKEAWEAVDQNWRVGVEYIYNQFQEVLSNNGIESIGKVGETFNAQLHESIESHGDSEEITEVRQKGYKMGDRVIRPAKVVLGQSND